MKMGIIGLPGAGKSTLFEALTGQPVPAETKRENRLAVVRVPDPRIDALSAMYKPKKTIFAQIDYFLPGTAAAQREEGDADASLWTKARDCDALIHVVRNFEDEAYGHPDPATDYRKIDEELVFSDLVKVEKRLERLDADAKKNKKPDPAELGLIGECRRILDTGEPLRRHPQIAGNPALRGYTFLSAKPVLVVANNGDHDPKLPDGLGGSPNERGVAIRGKVEREIAQMSAADASEFLAEFGIKESAMSLVIRESYSLLGLVSFFTVGEDEVRAWTIRRDTKAVDAAEEIHTDIKKGFIRAEVVAYDDLTASGSHAEARKKGQVRLEGKEYPMKDGDVVEFRFNVGKG
jgi:ribosome-binding ATPase